MYEILVLILNPKALNLFLAVLFVYVGEMLIVYTYV